MNNVTPLRQTEKQRRSSEIAEAKFGKRNPLTQSYYPLKQKSEFSQNVMMNRYIMKKTKNYGDISSYTSSVLELKRAA